MNEIPFSTLVVQALKDLTREDMARLAEKKYRQNINAPERLRPLNTMADAFKRAKEAGDGKRIN